MTMRARQLNAPRGGVIATVLAGLWAVLTVMAGLALMLTALLFGVVVAAAAMLWKRTGRRRGHMAGFGWRGGSMRSRARTAQGDIIDVEVREVAMPQRQSGHGDAGRPGTRA